MRLVDLEPRWFGDGTRTHLGVTFLCPHCRRVRLGVAFKNPVDGGPPVNITGPWHIDEVHYRRTFDVAPGGAWWSREGFTFEDLTLSPSIDASRSGHWHGFIQRGNIS